MSKSDRPEQSKDIPIPVVILAGCTVLLLLLGCVLLALMVFGFSVPVGF